MRCGAGGPERPLLDERTGTKVRYLSLRRGRPMSAFYLFNYSLRDACKAAGLVDADGRATVTAHRFRHTVGTQLAERGAKLHTIVTVLGHESPHMYARISDAEVLRDYLSVLEPGAVIAGAGAKAIRAGALSAGAVDWLRSNFLKTELELGHCLRLPSEGPCECDLYLSCARFVTTPAYAPRLRERHRLELSLADDARNRPGRAMSSVTVGLRDASSSCCRIPARRSSETHALNVRASSPGQVTRNRQNFPFRPLRSLVPAAKSGR